MRRPIALLALLLWLGACGVGPVGAWKPAAQPPVLINPGMITLPLPGDRVGVFGGIVTSTGQPAAQTLIYDSNADRWSQGSALPEARYGESTAVLRDGEILFTGGFGQSTQTAPPMLKTTYLYDSAHDAWRRVGNLNTPRANAQTVVLSDGKVLIVGGADDRSAELFDPSSGLWSRVGSTNEQRAGEILAPLPGGRALVAGGCASGNGFGQTPTSLTSAEIFDETSGAWQPARAMPEGRCSAAGLSLPDGRVLVLSGFSTFGAPSTDVLVFDASNDSWGTAGRTAASGSPFNGQPLQATILTDHRIFVPEADQGQQRGGLRSLVVGGQIFDPTSGSWTYTTSTSAVSSQRFGAPQVEGTAATGATVLVLLENNALVFDPAAPPPHAAVLDSSSLTLVLLALAAALLVAIAIVYVTGRLRA